MSQRKLAVTAAVTALAANWAQALAEGCKPSDLLGEIDLAVDQLNHFKQEAAAYAGEAVPVPALVLEKTDSGNGYTLDLSTGHKGCSIKVQDICVHISSKNDGVEVGLLPSNGASIESIKECFLSFDAAKAAIAQERNETA